MMTLDDINERLQDLITQATDLKNTLWQYDTGLVEMDADAARRAFFQKKKIDARIRVLKSRKAGFTEGYEECKTVSHAREKDLREKAETRIRENVEATTRKIQNVQRDSDEKRKELAAIIKILRKEFPEVWPEVCLEIDRVRSEHRPVNK